MKKIDFVNECKNAKDRKHLLSFLVNNSSNDTVEMISTMDISKKVEYINKAYDDDLHLKTNPNIYISSAWIERDKTHNFSTILKYLERGCKVKRKSWNDNTCLIYARGFHIIKRKPNGHDEEYIALPEDLVATDWIVI